MRKRLALLVADSRVCPAFASLGANDAALQSNWLGTGHWQQVINLEVARHGGDSRGAHSLAHRLIEERGDNAAVQVAGVAAEVIGDGSVADDQTIVGDQELKLQSMRINGAAAEAAVLRGVLQRSQIFHVSRHLHQSIVAGRRLPMRLHVE